MVFNNFTERFWVQPFVKLTNSLVHIFFAGGNSAFIVAIGHILGQSERSRRLIGLSHLSTPLKVTISVQMCQIKLNLAHRLSAK
jgi:hypothetical protein